MNDDLISRQAAIDIFDDYNIAVENGEIESYRRYREQLSCLPSVQPKTGRWVKYHCCDCFRCSKCDTPSLNRFKYCCGCGAKMEMEET